MGKTSKWITNFLTGKRDKEKYPKEKSSRNQTTITENAATPNISTPTTNLKDKRRWSFRRPSSASNVTSVMDGTASMSIQTASTMGSSDNEQKRHTMAVAMASAAAADAAAHAAAAAVRPTSTSASPVEEAAATKIQSVFRSYLARKALCALKGLVKLQALVRGHLVRKQATATLRCMQALVTAQVRARIARIRIIDNLQSSTYRNSTQDHTFRNPDQMEENIKIVEMDLGDTKESKNRSIPCSNHTQTEHHGHFIHPQFSKHYDDQRLVSLAAPSAVADVSQQTYSTHFEDNCWESTSQQHNFPISKHEHPTKRSVSYTPQDYTETMLYKYKFSPNYMASTESSKARLRSQSAPKQRPSGAFERELNKPRNVPSRGVQMQRSSSHILSSTAQNYQHPWSIALSTTPTNSNYLQISSWIPGSSDKSNLFYGT